MLNKVQRFRGYFKNNCPLATKKLIMAARCSEEKLIEQVGLAITVRTALCFRTEMVASESGITSSQTGEFASWTEVFFSIKKAHLFPIEKNMFFYWNREIKWWSFTNFLSGSVAPQVPGFFCEQKLRFLITFQRTPVSDPTKGRENFSHPFTLPITLFW